MAILDHDPSLLTDRPGLLIIGDKGYISRELDSFLTERGARLLRPSYRNRTPHPGEHLLKPVRQLIESVNDTSKANSTSNCTAAAPSTASPPHRPTPARPRRRHQAQPRHRPTHHTITNRLRPLTG